MSLQYKKLLSSKFAGYCFVILAIINYSGNIVAARAMGDVMPPAMLNVYRWGLATLFVLPFCLGPMWRERKMLQKYFVTVCALALLGISLFDLFLFIAGQTTPALNIALISTMSPLMTAVVARVFIGERNTLAMYIGCVISMCGIAYLVTDGNLSELADLHFGKGDIFVILTSLMSAIYNTTLKAVSDKISQTALLGSMFVLGFLFLIPIYFWEVGSSVEVVEFTSEIWTMLVYLALGASALCYLFWNLAVVSIGATRITLFYYVIPLLSGVIAWMFLGEPVTNTQLQGSVMIFGGIILSMLSKSSGKVKPQKAGEAATLASAQPTPVSHQ